MIIVDTKSVNYTKSLIYPLQHSTEANNNPFRSWNAYDATNEHPVSEHTKPQDIM